MTPLQLRRHPGGPMRLRSRPAWLLVPALLLSQELQSQATIGSISLDLGGARADVLSRLRSVFRVDSMTTSASDQWMLRNRQGPPSRVLGVVAFTAGRLSFISRAWDPAPPRDENSILQAVIRALSQLDAADAASCHVSGSRTSQPDSDFESVVVACGSHRVSISVSVGRNAASGISESWRARP